MWPDGTVIAGAAQEAALDGGLYPGGQGGHGVHLQGPLVPGHGQRKLSNAATGDFKVVMCLRAGIYIFVCFGVERACRALVGQMDGA